MFCRRYEQTTRGTTLLYLSISQRYLVTILPQILGSLPTIFFRTVTDHPPTDHHRSWTSFKWAQHTSATPLARRRARPAHRRRELVAQLRRRSRDVLVLPDPGPVLRSSLENGGGGGTEECRRAAGLVGRLKPRRRPER